MRAIGLRSAAALLIAVVLACPAGLLFTAAPAAAAPGRTAAVSGPGPSLLDAFTAWLAALWPGAGPAVQPRHGIDLDPNGGPAVQRRHGGDLDLDGGPAIEPQLGIELDPNG